MSDIDELQGRIAAALDRIGQGIDLRGRAAAADPEELETLRRDLEDERIANEQLKERIKVLKSRREALETELTTVQEAARTVAQLDSELQGLREANEKLRDINTRLREANAAGVAEPDLINTAMLAELDGVRAARVADRAEAGAVYDALAAAIAGIETDQGTVDEQPEGS
ncbi:hypothetical protein [Roseovarius amoyensis]|uniref:hypothetical protein n=1 Tax=Roseovarius amoyensis TaxID=2211448 RepID=UPI000DBE7600|nr:hypothetical protein [Roseovarius amoyensis]